MGKVKDKKTLVVLIQRKRTGQNPDPCSLLAFQTLRRHRAKGLRNERKGADGI